MFLPLAHTCFAGYPAPDLAASNPLAYYNAVETCTRLVAQDRNGFPQQHLHFLLQLPNLLAGQGQHTLVPTAQHYKAYMSAYTSWVKGWIKLLPGKGSGENGGDSIFQCLDLLPIMPLCYQLNRWVGVDLEQGNWCVDPCRIEGSEAWMKCGSFELALVLQLARAVAAAIELVVGPVKEESTITSSSSRSTGGRVDGGSSRNRAKKGSSSSSGMVSTAGRGAVRASPVLLGKLLKVGWDLDTLLLTWLNFSERNGAAAAAGSPVRAADGERGAPCSASASSSNVFSMAGACAGPVSARLAGTIGIYSTMFPEGSSSRGTNQPSAATRPALDLPKRLGKLPSDQLPEPVLLQLFKLQEWREKELGVDQQLVAIEELRRLCLLLLAEVPIPLGCSNPACVNLARKSEGDSGLADKWCSGCKLARYCSRECQVTHWKRDHYAMCKKLAGNSNGGKQQ